MSPKIEINEILNRPNFVEEGRERTKRRQDLLELARALQELEGEVASTKGRLSPSPERPVVAPGGVGPAFVLGQDPDQPTLEEALAQMTLALQLLEVFISKADNSRAKSDEKIGQAEIDLAQAIFEDISKQLKKIEKAAHSASTLNFWTKILEVMAATIITVVALAFGQAEIALLTIFMTGLSAGGAFDKLASELSEGLQKRGMGQLAADIVSRVLILIVVTGLTILIAPTSVASDAAKTGTSVGEGVAQGAVGAEKVGSSVAREIIDFMNKVGGVLKKLNLFTRLGVRANMAIMTAMQVISQININQILEDIPMNDKRREKIELAVTIVILVATILASIGCGAALSELMATGSVAKNGSFLSKMLEPITKAINGNAKAAEIIANMDNLRRALTAIAGTFEIAEGVIVIQQGDLTIALANDNADLELVQTSMGMMSSVAASSVAQDAKIQEQHGQADGNFATHFADGEKEFARLFTLYSPV